ncbi:MAG: 1-acyl-sn-glycerol-3-phosphate acyltransferase [Bacteroidaceae bacterium]|jgi:putative hemolysin|nr:1-acyl-sn-glycerol-3-phosphate acyltransferase [Bacteroidaceae bacterium]
MNETLQIDIDKILAAKAGNKARYVPRFLVSYLKKIVHQDEVNAFLLVNNDKRGLDFVNAFMEYFNNAFEIEGLENLPKDGLCTFVSNHPLGAQDGLGLAYILGPHYRGKIKFLVNDLLMNIPHLAEFWVPINKTGRQARNFPQQVNAAFESDNHIVMFPAGLCSRKSKGVIRDLEWKKTFITKSVQTQRDIVPIHFEGENSKFFYRLANVNRMLGIKFNIAMLYLSDEMFRNRNKKFKVTIGKPIPWQTFDKSKTPTEWAQYVKDVVYTL